MSTNVTQQKSLSCCWNLLEGLKMRVIGLPCPHCEQSVRAIKSRTMSPMLKEITYRCQNEECGHVFVAGLEVLRTLSLSAQPNYAVKIPISQHARASALNQLSLNLQVA
ncbi:ogr/Delta-like zinc finger family protein [Undibacterium sp. SXout7W]|uniref:ogr/Delta-like zinc finger family protein n=1 Tax=Undibacterium sp. SXout7W TaxID=3413049 RepID=UPI003BF3C7AA